MTGIPIPFVKEGIDSLWGSSGIADAIQNKLSSGLKQLFDSQLEVSADDIINLDIDGLTIKASNSGLVGEYTANLRVNDYQLDFNLSADTLSFFTDIGFDVTKYLGAKVSQSEPLKLAATLDLIFGFGIDTTGQFYIEDPTLVGQVSLDHKNPLDVSLSIGPVGVGINDATIHFNAGLSLPTYGRFSPDDLKSAPSLGLPKFDSNSSFDINIPLELQTSLAGLNKQIGRLYGSLNVLKGDKSPIANLTAKQFFSLLPQNINFEGDGFGSLLELSKVSLDTALEGVKQVFTAANHCLLQIT
jgi:hypothetical protein